MGPRLKGGAGVVVLATLLAAVIAAGGPGTGGGDPTPTPSPTATATVTPGQANIWVQFGGGTCAGGRSSTTITFASASSPDRICGDFDTACRAMNAGDLALVMSSSSFQEQTLSSSCNGTSGNIKRICVAPGETVTITDGGAVNWDNADYVWVCGKGWGPWVDNNFGVFRWEAPHENNASATSVQPGTTGSGMDGWEVDGNDVGGDADTTACKPVAGQNVKCATQWAYLKGSTSFTISRSDMCCNNDKGIYPEHTGTAANTNVLIEKNRMHDQAQLTITVGDGAHYECIYNNGSHGLTVRQNWFEGCRSTGAMNTTCIGGCLSAGDAPTNLLFENNIVGSTYIATSFDEHSPAIDGGLQLTGYYRIYNNLIKNGVATYNNGVTSIVGNVMGPAAGGCGSAGASWSYNLRPGGSTCGTGDQISANVFTNNAFYADSARATSGNYCPSASSPTIGAGPPSTATAVDYLGRSRNDGDPDAGPYEGTC
jgi:hypothetical protein